MILILYEWKTKTLSKLSANMIHTFVVPGEVPLTTQNTPTLRNQQRSIPKGVRPHLFLINLPAMEEVTDCQSVSSLEMTDLLDFEVGSRIASNGTISEDDDIATQQKKRRLYRSNYLRCKRLRSKGYSVPLPVKPWQYVPESASIATVPSILSKDDIRRIKNRESAERSRKAINSAIEQAQNDLKLAQHEWHTLQGERAFLLQRLAMYTWSNNGVYVVEPSPILVAPPVMEVDTLSTSGDSLSDLTQSSLDSTSDLNFDFDSTLNDEALELLMNNLY